MMTYFEHCHALQAIIEMHKLQCGALACQRSSVTERISPGPSSPRTPIPDKPDVPTEKTVDVTPSPMGNSPLPSIDKKSTREGEGTPKKQIDKEEKKKNERKRAEEERWENERKRAEEERLENERKRAEEERWENERKRAEEERWENERKRAEEEQRRRDNESDRKKREKKRKKQEEFRKDGETHRSYEERQREREEERRIQNEKRREDEMRKVIQLYRPPKFTTIKSSPRRRAAKGYFRILWRRPVMHNEGMMYLSPYLR
ncbi:capping protein inhibiting regulator of actin dynamics-like [Ylistrum balloti]|uniref:capping protein inhibiting regulator of actin dynamics-like n=1 Tax=Ylistrum balloti TaxID=509963 RepID=UPI002905C587|nr:capping protein inhibiting regulator of actin dynamics-like [Ylistrum balloti]